MRYSISLLFIAAMSTTTPVFTQTPELDWAVRFVGTGDPLIRVNAGNLAVDANGNIYTLGVFNGPVDFDPGPGVFIMTPTGGYDVFITKLDRTGDFLWAKSWGGHRDEFRGGIALDENGNIYSVGVFHKSTDLDPGPGRFNLHSKACSTGYILVLDNDGNFVWGGELDGDDMSCADDLALDANGNIYVTGYFSGTVDLDPGPGTFEMTDTGFRSSFVLALDSERNFLWAKQKEGVNYMSGGPVAVDSNGYVYNAQTFAGTVDFDPGPGTYFLTSAGEQDVCVSVLDSAGEFVWARQLGGVGDDRGDWMAVDLSGTVHTVGRFYDTADFDPGPETFNLTPTGTHDAFVSALDSAGNFLWARQIEGDERVWPHRVALDTSGNSYIAGWFSGTADFCPGPFEFLLTSRGGHDAFLAVLDSAGNFVWAGQWGDERADSASGLALNASSKVITSGHFNFTPDFDPGPGTYELTGTGCLSAFVSVFNLCDDDDDDWVCAESDCDDGNPDVFPGAPEVNDGMDNQCWGDFGYGIADEISAISGFHNAADKNEYSWTAQPGATLYEVARSTVPDFSTGCMLIQTTNPYWVDFELPGVNRCYYYLSRAVMPNLGSWGQYSSGVERDCVCP